MKSYSLFLFLLITSFFYSCSPDMNKDEDLIEKQLKSFAENYFNFDYSRALPFTTPESYPWIRFAVSNVMSNDLDALHEVEEEATASVDDIHLVTDSTATAVCKMKNVFVSDSIGKGGHLTDEVVYHFNLVKRNGHWLVKMEGLPRSAQ